MKDFEKRIRDALRRGADGAPTADDVLGTLRAALPDAAADRSGGGWRAVLPVVAVIAVLVGGVVALDPGASDSGTDADGQPSAPTLLAPPRPTTTSPTAPPTARPTDCGRTRVFAEDGGAIVQLARYRGNASIVTVNVGEQVALEVTGRCAYTVSGYTTRFRILADVDPRGRRGRLFEGRSVGTATIGAVMPMCAQPRWGERPPCFGGIASLGYLHVRVVDRQ